ncbi:MAG: efflux RND transporter periplasmic adaptor subunit, partial [Anaerolineaceae bacterium]
MLKKKRLLIILAAFMVLGAGGYAVFLQKPFSVKAQTTETPVQTATAFIGSVTISATGMGTVIAAEEASVGFYKDGVVGELLVSVGDEVEKGDLLARQANTDDLDLAVTEAELQLRLAQSALQAIYDGYDSDLANARLTAITAQASLEDSQDSHALLQYGRCADEIVEDYYDAYVRAEREYNRINASSVADAVKQDAKDVLQRAWASYNFCMTPYTDTEKAEGAANLSVAEAALSAAKAQYEKLQSGVDEKSVAQAKADIAEAEYNLSVAKKALEGASIYAPISGTIMSVDAMVGDTVSGSFITINQTQPITLSVSLDETDLNSIAKGYEVEVTFDAFSSQVFTGHVTQVNPGLSSMMNSSVLTAEVELDADSYSKPQGIPIGMSAAVEVINDRAEQAVLVPVEAVLELGINQHALFVMQNGKPVLREVTIGIQDGAYIVISSGLE